MIRSIALGAAGMVAGAGVWVGLRTLFASRRTLMGDLAHLNGALDHAGGTDRAVRLADVARALTRVIRRVGLTQFLLLDELALVGREPDTHTLVRLTRVLVGASIGAAVAVSLLAIGVGIPPLGIPASALAGMLFGLVAADRPVHRLAAARRSEATLAVAAFIDLGRILLVGGLPLNTALRAAADAGTGWGFAQLRGALAAAKERGLPPDAGLGQLAARLPVPAFADLARTVTSARRGASPVTALESRAEAIRAGEAAQIRGEEAAADAQMELPAAVVAIAFVGYLTYPLLTLIGTAGPR